MLSNNKTIFFINLFFQQMKIPQKPFQRGFFHYLSKLLVSSSDSNLKRLSKEHQTYGVMTIKGFALKGSVAFLIQVQVSRNLVLLIIVRSNLLKFHQWDISCYCCECAWIPVTATCSSSSSMRICFFR